MGAATRPTARGRTDRLGRAYRCGQPLKNGATPPASEALVIDIATWLRDLDMQQYTLAFRDNGVDMRVLPKLTAEDLKDIGVSMVGHRRILLEAIASLRGPSLLTSRDAGSQPIEAHPLEATEAERRQLTVMFCDLVGSTALSVRLDPEALRGVIGAYHRCCADVIGRAGGLVAKYMGDGVLVYFGYPRAHEDDAERAVRAGLSVIGAVGRLDVRSVKLQGRIGIATGLTIVGDLIGEGSAQEQSVVGETPNLAARLQAPAGPNGIVIDAATRQQTGTFFKFRGLGTIALKGLPNPVPAWEVLEEAAVESRFEALRAEMMTPLVGRQEELIPRASEAVRPSPKSRNRSRAQSSRP
jgi:class 3 adenylate cyclase